MMSFVHCRENVESCENWSQSTTQQVDLAFNIFFMIYFFIRVSTNFILFKVLERKVCQLIYT